MKTIEPLLAAVVSAALTFGMVAQAGEHKGEKVDMKTLPEAVQQTITEKAAGGEIVRVEREDDQSGKWNYEVIVKTDGKKWGFEVDPDGKFVKKHDDHTKTHKN
jgi:uncharacterized membrane protein YkoI